MGPEMCSGCNQSIHVTDRKQQNQLSAGGGLCALLGGLCTHRGPGWVYIQPVVNETGLAGRPEPLQACQLCFRDLLNR